MKPHDGPTLTVVSQIFAPQVSGSPILLANMLSHFTGKVNTVAGYNRYSKIDPAFRAPCTVQTLALPRTFPILTDRLERRLPGLLSRVLRIFLRRALKNLSTDVVLAVFPHETYVVAAFLVARQMGLPFYVHMHDLWSENKPAGTAAARFAATWEPVILKHAQRVLCMTEAMQEHYAKKYGIKTYLLPHSIPEEDYQKAPAEPHVPQLPKPTILFVGAVSPEMNLDALKVLADASELLPVEYELLFCTSFDLALLQRFGIRSSRLRATYVSRAEVQRLQSNAHVLVAVLSHKNGSPLEVQTVFSTKLLEYLVAGRPIVVFAPPGSYHAESARRNGWGYVVDEDSPTALAAGLLTVVKDKKLAARLVAGARREAEARRALHHAARLREWVLADTHNPTEQVQQTPEGVFAGGH